MPFGNQLGVVEQGFFSLYSGFAQQDSTRPLMWVLTPDGLVTLSGWVRWTDATTTVAVNEERTFGGVALTDSPAVPPGIRDCSIRTEQTALHFIVKPSGKLFFRWTPPPGVTATAYTLTQNQSWFSFDQIFWRNNAP